MCDKSMCDKSLYDLRVAEDYARLVQVGEYMASVTPSAPNVYEELCIGYYHTDKKRLSYMCLEKIFDLRPRDSTVLDRAVFNKKMFERQFVDEQWVPSFIPDVGEHRVVTVTVTSCKRLPLFIRTIDSFMRCCVDKTLIREIVCFDDNSSEDDRAVMRELFPFITYTFKGEADRGHAKSMQMIADRVSTRYAFHLEDDWLITNRICLSDLIEIVEDDPTIKQVCLNRNYAEVPEKKIEGGIERYTKGNLRYFVHEHSRTPEQQDAFRKRHGGVGLFCDYWPHFSLTPGLLDASIFRVVRFKDVPDFERIFADEYASQGWVTAFHQEANSRHIGRLIGERDRPNAYELNNVRQF